MDGLYIKVYLFFIIVLSAVFHEYSHGLMAYKLGDDTAKRSGRLTLNPLVHLDMLGTIIMPILSLLSAGIFIGWAKPTPYNPNNLSDRRYGNLKVALAGPLSNLIIAITLGIVVRVLSFMSPNPIFIEFLAIAIYINIFLMLFNLIPVPPLDGSKVLMDITPNYYYRIAKFGILGIFIALMVAFYILPFIATFLFKIITGLNGF